jgi:hypothetical protein
MRLLVLFGYKMCSGHEISLVSSGYCREIAHAPLGKPLVQRRPASDLPCGRTITMPTVNHVDLFQ